MILKRYPWALTREEHLFKDCVRDGRRIALYAAARMTIETRCFFYSKVVD